MENKLSVAAITFAVLALGVSVLGGGETIVERIVERDLGAISGPDINSYVNVNGELGFRDKTKEVAATSVYSTSTLTLADSGTTYYVSASGTTMTLPSLADGAWFRFVVDADVDTGNVIVDSAEGDNISGTLTVNAADVDCADEDQINIVNTADVIGDFVEVRSDGDHWVIGDSIGSAAGSLTCTDD